MSARRLTPQLHASLAARLTHRDRHILRMVWEHRVLTAPQIAQLAFDSDDTARRRLLILHQLGALERFRLNLPVGDGTTPFHYVLGPAGAAVLAAEDGIDYADFGYRRDRALAIAYSAKLTHTIGVNGFFTALAAHTRRAPAARLVTWWPEHRCTKVWGDTARPDAYGRWHEDGSGLDFFLEYDTGTETLDRVARKLHAYAALTRTTGIRTPVLFSVHSPRRETNLRARLKLHPDHSIVPIATAGRTAPGDFGADGPAGRIWLPLHEQQHRQRLADAWPPLDVSTGPPPTRVPFADLDDEDEHFDL